MALLKPWELGDGTEDTRPELSFCCVTVGPGDLQPFQFIACAFLSIPEQDETVNVSSENSVHTLVSGKTRIMVHLPLEQF